MDMIKKMFFRAETAGKISNTIKESTLFLLVVHMLLVTGNIFLSPLSRKSQAPASLLVLVICLLSSNSIIAEQATPEQIKSALTYNFFRYIQWPSDDKIKVFKIALLSKDEKLIKEMKRAAPLINVRGRSFQVSRIRSIKEIDTKDTQLLYVGADFMQNTSLIANRIRRTGTLLVTEESDGKHDLMINLRLQPDGNMQFEVNRTNVIFEHLILDRDILLLGGSELDVAELFRETDQRLQTIKSELITSENKLKQLEESSKTKQRQLIEQQKLTQDQLEKLDNQKNKLNEQVKIIENQSSQIQVQESQLKSTVELVEQKEQQLSDAVVKLKRKQDALSQSQIQLNSRLSILQEKEHAVESLTSLIEENNRILDQQLGYIGEQSAVISQQRFWLLASLAALLVFAVMIIAILKINIARKRAINEVMSARNQAQQYLDIAGTIIVAIDDKQCIKLINKKGCEVLGAKAGDIIGENWFELFIPEHVREDVKKTYGKIMLGDIRLTKYVENTVVTRSGEELTIAWHNTIIKDSEDNIIGTLSSGEDITERLIANAELKQAKDAAETANRTKSGFLANMSHELRTPLNAILGFSQIMQNDSSFPAQHKLSLNTINRSGEHLLALINDVLEVSKIEAGQIKISQDNFNILRMLEELIQMFTVRTDKKGLSLIYTHAEHMPSHIVADEGKLRQILINLLGNAVKFTENGAIELRASMQNEDDHSGHMLCIEVQDSGPGIEQQAQKKLFNAFEQTEKGAAKGGGTGLGLAISSQYAKVMEGYITLESRVGEGSVFSLNLPVKLGDAASIALDQEGPKVISLAPGAGTPKVLIVDDIESNRQLLLKMLEPIGFTLREADDGNAAVSLFEAWQPDLILMDWVMPGMDGLEASRRIKQTSAGKDTSIICISATVFEEERQEIFDAGVDEFIGKPYRESELLEKIKQLLKVNYLYDNQEKNLKEKVMTHEQQDLDIAILQSLPEDQRRTLYHAVMENQLETMEMLISHVAETDAMVAIRLWELTDEAGLSTLTRLFSKLNSIEDKTGN